VKRSPFPWTPFHGNPGRVENPLPLMVAFLFLALAVGLSWTWMRLAASSAGVLVFLILPRPSLRALGLLLRFLPLLIIVMLIHVFPWRGFGEGLPWFHDSSGWMRGLLALSRFALWIILSARVLEGIHPAALMSHLPRNPRLARWALVPVMAFGFLDFFLREAFLLEKAWRARGGSNSLRHSHWPSLLLPLFRGMLSRGDRLAESLALRSFPRRWAGGEKLRWSVSSLSRFAIALLILALVWSEPWISAP
jgi:hypothetical protein